MGLGAHLYEALGKKVPVIGVAKTPFKGAPHLEIFRGSSKSALYITAIGIEAVIAAEHVKKMHGPFRIPTVLRKADHLARGVKYS
jgi:deoxyribonuclease V